jgi:hypothetical protein
MKAEDNEILRRAVLEALVNRHPVPMATRAVRRVAETSVPFQFDDLALNSALEYLRDEALIRFEPDPIGSTKWWSATSAGLKAMERK